MTRRAVTEITARDRSEMLDGLFSTVIVLVAAVVIGYLVAAHSQGLLHNKMLPWILSRSLGLASYVCLSALVLVGIWYRHPWRTPRRAPGPQTLLRAHACLAAGTVMLLAGHVVAIALDHYAGVGWGGVFVPWHAVYRPTATALGTVAMYGILLVATTAALAGSIGRRVWLPIHAFSAALFALCLAHGLLAGSDSNGLGALYVVTGGLVLTLQGTKLTARPVELAETW